jgi:anti-sigma28 factor (negative regulator of flagellin synthesis)
MKVTESNPLALPSVRPGSSAARAPESKPSGKSTDQTQVSLAPAAQSVFGARTERVAALKLAIETGAYKPNSQSTSEKLVSGALSRPE